MKNLIFIQESEVINYLYNSNLITNQKKRSILGMMNKDYYAVKKYIDNTNLFEAFIGHFGCGVECCGHKINYKLK